MAESAAQQRELDRIDSLEPRPPPSVPLPYLDSPLGDLADPRRFSPAFTRMEKVVRDAAMADRDLEGPGDAAVDPDGVPLFGTAFDITPDSIIFAALGTTPPLGVDPKIIPPLNIRAAQARPDYAAPFGWKAAMQKEINRAVAFKALRIAPARQYFKDQLLYGKERVSVGFIVSVLTCKADPAGDPRGGGVTNKFRVAVAESKGSELSKGQTYSSCADEISNRVITAIGPTLEAHQTSIDVGGA
jgi:hypothetical protein